MIIVNPVGHTLTSAQAADRLGVKPETLYAYVSRGLLTVSRAADGRRSLFDPKEVERLARRGRPRRSTHGPTIDVSIRTAVTRMTPAGPVYRGHLASGLARTTSFEQVAELLWSGALPSEHREWAGHEMRAPVPLDGEPTLERLRLVVGVVAARPEVRHEPPDALGRLLVGALVDAFEPLGERVPRLRLHGRSQPLRATVAGRLVNRLVPGRPPAGLVETVNGALVLLADHELAVSTLAARVAASARADVVSCVSAALGPMAGPLHGTASRRARVLLDDVAERGAVRAVSAHLTRSGRLPGFGHVLYPDIDPRATVLLGLLGEVRTARRSLRLVEDVAAEGLARGAGHPNVDLALAALGQATGMAPDGPEAVFVVARTAGWIAHALEELGERPLRFRARATYVGPS